MNNGFVKLENIYYLQEIPALQGSFDQNSIDTTHLVKLGNELHGPDDAMFINRSQVLFWENLREDGKVLKAIREYEKSGYSHVFKA